ncbi:MAG TPA: hypothetical protein VF331_19985 [Polyangiales bacterium]
MLTQHIALVPEGNGVNASDLARVSAALQKQVVRDLTPLWSISATVDAFPNLEDVPVGYWPIVVTFRPLGHEAGVRVDRNGQPYALVELCASWSLSASRACLEMLVNPSGNRSVTTASPRTDQGPVELLLEVCAPCEDPRHAYVINDVLVADFCTPAFYGAGSGIGHVRYTFTAAAAAPFELLPGGHLTWYDPVSDSWWLRTHSGDNVVDTRLGAVEGSLSSVRELVFARAPRRLGPGALSIEAFEARTGVSRQHALQASQYRAHRLRAQLTTGRSAQQATADVVQTRQDVHVWPLAAAARTRESSVQAAEVVESKVFEKHPSKQLTRDAERQLAAAHFDLLVELLADEPDAPASESEQAERPDEAPAAQAARSNPPPLPTAAPSGSQRAASATTSVQPLAAAATTTVEQAAAGSRTPADLSVPPRELKSAVSPLPPRPSASARPRVRHAPEQRAASPVLVGVLVAVACLAVGWGARNLFNGATQSQTSAQDKPLSTPAAVTSASDLAGPQLAVTQLPAALPAPQPAAAAPGACTPGRACVDNAALQATASASAAQPSLSKPPVGAAPVAATAPLQREPALAPGAPATPPASAGAAQLPAPDLLASSRRHGRHRADVTADSPASAPAPLAPAAAVGGGSLDDLIDSRR